MSQRLVRAKRKIAAAGIPLRIPDEAELPARLNAVLVATYAAFAEGWGDPAGSDPTARGLVAEAIALGRVIVDACPREPEALGLLALMLHADARRDARRDAVSAYVPLDEQDVTRWDAAAIGEAESLLQRASRCGRIGRFQLEGAIQSAYARRIAGLDPDWPAIAALYDALLALTGSPVVALNRAVAVGRVQGATAGLTALDAIASDARMHDYQPYWAARADLLARAGNRDEALDAYARAIGLAVDPAVRSYLAARAERAPKREAG
jgi:RNA polymerase sigma-70 factor (ECF subfamily)